MIVLLYPVHPFLFEVQFTFIVPVTGFVLICF